MSMFICHDGGNTAESKNTNTSTHTHTCIRTLKTKDTSLCESMLFEVYTVKMHLPIFAVGDNKEKEEGKGR